MKSIYITVALILCFFLFIYTPLPSRYENHRDAILQHLADETQDHLPAPGHRSKPASDGQKFGTTSRYAFATFLAGTGATDTESDFDEDHYFVATRILAYQLLHAPETRTNAKIPFVVLATHDVSEVKQARLRKDGAVVIVVEPVDPGWVITETSTWKDVMTKLRLWELTQFERILFLDGDTVLTRPLDDVFDDPAVKLQVTRDNTKYIVADEGTLPLTYAFAGVPETKRVHSYPPTEENHSYPNLNYLNAGFFVLRPSIEAFNYYTSLLIPPSPTTPSDKPAKQRFVPEFPEQNLLNHAHRREGNMPWLALNNTWNIHYPSAQDLHGDVATLHEKWWAPFDPEIGPFLQSWRWRMQGFFEARDSVVELGR
ncbi:hypothetical protein LTR66_012412 [Elasticomyces elasticus]|nr:hypothetical protein LTR66_012412 [Elasticomyces elasticus]